MLLKVRALEDAILKHARIRPGSYLPLHLSGYNTGGFTAAGGGTGDRNLLEPLAIFEQRLAQADSYLQMLLQQLGALEGKPEPVFGSGQTRHCFATNCQGMWNFH